MIRGVFPIAIRTGCSQNTPVAILPPGLTPIPRVLIHSTETILPIAIKGATETPEANPEDGKCLSINSGVILDASEINVIPLWEYSEDDSGPSYYRFTCCWMQIQLQEMANFTRH